MSRRPSLRAGIDRDIYQIIRRLEDESGNSAKRLTVSTVYDSIKRSNSSLARQKRRPLEDSIDRVLSVRKDEIKADATEEDSDALIEAEEKFQSVNSTRDESLINRQLTKHWAFKKTIATPTSGAATESEAMDVDPAPPIERLPNGESKGKRKRRDRSVPKDRSPPTDLSLDDLAGIDGILKKLMGAIYHPLKNAKGMLDTGYKRNDGGVLLIGPSGCGKTTLARILAAELSVPYIPMSGPSLVGGTSGESEKNIREVFEEAQQNAPCIMFIDDMDTIAGKRTDTSKGMEARMITELCNGIDRIGWMPEGSTGFVVLLAATSKPDAIDPDVRRRFSLEIDMAMPDQRAREQILKAMTRNARLADDVDFVELAKLTPGFVGGDLRQVVDVAFKNNMDNLLDARVARLKAAHNLSDDTERPVQSQLRIACAHEEDAEDEQARRDNKINFDNFKAAIASVQPAAKREGFSAIPDTTWAHVGAMADVRRQLETTIIGPIKRPERYASVGIQAAAGILLWGPPGCGKTLVAKAVANESKANFISIKGPEILSKWVGESERSVRQLFSRARSMAPCVLFFDEMDALVSRRDDGISDAGARVVNAFLTELDGVGDRSGIYVIGATNRPDIIDPAIRRPGRLGTSIYIGLPTAAERVDILRTLYNNAVKNQNGEENLAWVAMDGRCEGFSGADLGNLMQAAGRCCLERTMDDDAAEPAILAVDWNKALDEVKPSVTDMNSYRKGLAS